MKKIKGNLIELALTGKFELIVHGCNCMCTMGAGIAKQIKQEFPEAYAADCKTIKADRQKLGTISYAIIQRNNIDLTVVNAYTQFNWRGKGVLVNYDAVRSAFKTIKKQFSGKAIAYPKIGAGLARGDWNIINQIIDRELQNENHTFVEFDP